MLVRPQPIGIYGGAAAHLLLPPIGSHSRLSISAQDALVQLMSGNLEHEMPQPWKFYVAAAQGRLEEAKRLLAETYEVQVTLNIGLGDSAREWLEQLFHYNRFVLEPHPQAWQRLRPLLKDETLVCLAQVVAYAYGLSSELPATELSFSELAAWSLAVVATKQLEQDDFIAARQSLVAAIALARPVSPLLYAILLAQSSQVAQHCHLPDELIQQDLQQAIDIAQTYQLPGFAAELYMQLGMLLQRSAASDRPKLLSAIRAYQSALQAGITEGSHSAMFAELQSNLGLCYLAMPQTESSTQLRTGIAIQSFRRALESLDKQLYSDLWARINMNLANALQYAPSSHPAENLIQAVEIYEHVLQVRSRARDPIAYALVIINQANALAHLGIFKPALEKASEAYKLFQWYDQAEAAASARELVENINARIEAAKDQRSPPAISPPAEDATQSRCDEELQHGTV